MRASLPLLLLLTGCSLIGADFSDDEDDGSDGPSQSEFARQYAEQICAWFEKCGYIDYAGGSFEACVDTQTQAVLNAVSAADCAYDAEAADACLSDLALVDCDGKGEPYGEDPCSLVCGKGDTG